MTTLDFLKYASIGLAGILAWLLLCIAIWGAPKTSKRQAEELADQAEALKKRQIAREDAMIAEIEQRLPAAREYITYLKQQERTLDNIREMAKSHGIILDAERALFTLKQRRALGDHFEKAHTYNAGA